MTESDNRFKGITEIAKGMQPVRSTFRLTRDSTVALRKLAKRMGTSEKEVIDAYVSLFSDQSSGDVSKLFFDALRATAGASVSGERKTRVVSRRSLRTLEAIAKQYETKRDWVLECVVHLAETLASKSQKMEKEKLLHAREKAEAMEILIGEKLAEIRELTDGTGIEIPDLVGMAGEIVGIIEDELRFYDGLERDELDESTEGEEI